MLTFLCHDRPVTVHSNAVSFASPSLGVILRFMTLKNALRMLQNCLKLETLSDAKGTLIGPLKRRRGSAIETAFERTMTGQ